MQRIRRLLSAALGLALLTGLAGCQPGTTAHVRLINVSYDPTREFYAAYNQYFQRKWAAAESSDVEVIQSHGGSGSQTRAVIEGLPAAVVTLALGHDIDRLVAAGLVDKDWQTALPQRAAPYTSTIVFLVRRGNPKQIKDWNDCVKAGVDVITPNPKSSGGACWIFLAAWSYARQTTGSEAQARAFVKALYDHVLVLDSGARAATTTFAQNRQGDVLLAWENEAYMTMQEHPGEYELVSPSVSIKAEPPVALVAGNVRGATRRAAQDYLAGLYDEPAQELAARYYYRPADAKVLARYRQRFDLQMKLTTIADFGGWEAAYAKFFADGAVFDQIM